MYTDAILEEIWKIKTDLAAEAGQDVDVLCDMANAFAAQQASSAPTFHSADEMRRYFADQAPATLAVGEAMPRYASNEILEEVWAIKDKLWQEAGGDMGKFCEQLREFEKTLPPPRPIVRNAEEIHRYYAEQEAAAKRAVEDPPKQPE